MQEQSDKDKYDSVHVKTGAWFGNDVAACIDVYQGRASTTCY